jgi:putative transcriptional regulator
MKGLSGLSTALPLLVAAVVCGLLVVAWAFGEPELAPLGVPALPALDAPCVGNVIAADPALTDRNFAGASIVLCWHDETGALGFILNRPLDLHVRSMLPDAPLGMGRLRLGGPLGKGQGAVLYRRDGELRFTTAELRAPFPSTGWARPTTVAWEDVLLVASGYAGWAPDQLEAEVEGGAWTLMDVEPERVLQRAK